MDHKVTENLWQQLMQTDDLDWYLEENDAHFEHSDFFSLIGRVFDRKGMSKAMLAEKAGVSSVYVYQIFGRRRLPSREKLIGLCVGMNASIEECQGLLKAAGMARLHPQKRREAIIIFGLLHDWNLTRLNEKLYDENEQTLE